MQEITTQGTYTTEDLAKLLNCSSRHVRRLDASRSIPGRITVGRLVRYSRKKIDDWLSGNLGSRLNK